MGSLILQWCGLFLLQLFLWVGFSLLETTSFAVVWQNSDSQTTTLPPSPAERSLQERDPLLVFATSFENGLEQWEFSDPTAWQPGQKNGLRFLSQFRKQSSYQPKVRSPLHLAILKDYDVGSFELVAEVRSTHEDYGHRDVCLFFGYQSATEFYYVHLGKQTDPNCNQIFLVNNADRKKISLTTNSGTKWDNDWHKIKIIRDVETGKMEIFFDDFSSPIMTASDQTFTSGRIGIGSFDDTADWAKVKLFKRAPKSK